MRFVNTIEIQPHPAGENMMWYIVTMNPITFLGIFNIVGIPFVIYAHAKGECNLLTQTLGSGAQILCEHAANPLLNLFYLNALFFLLGLVVYANSQVVSSPPRPAPKKPSH